MGYENLIVDKSERTAIVTINRPKVLNALNKDTLVEMLEVVQVLEQDNEVDVVLLPVQAIGLWWPVRTLPICKPFCYGRVLWNTW